LPYSSKDDIDSWQILIEGLENFTLN
jgi:hypothetical protein